jgi:hypothetical protein
MMVSRFDGAERPALNSPDRFAIQHPIFSFTISRKTYNLHESGLSLPMPAADYKPLPHNQLSRRLKGFHPFKNKLPPLFFEGKGGRG